MLMVALVAMLGCGGDSTPSANASSNQSGNSSIPSWPVEAEPCEDCPEEASPPESYEFTATPAQPEEERQGSALDPPASLMDVNWISPGKVVVANFHPGAVAHYPLSVHNGGDAVALFAVTYRHPDNVEEGYDKPTEIVQEWVIIADESPILQPKETRDISVTLSMPEDADSFSPQWEFWVSVIDMSQKGFVRTELCCRWLVTMRAD